MNARSGQRTSMIIEMHHQDDLSLNIHLKMRIKVLLARNDGSGYAADAIRDRGSLDEKLQGKARPISMRSG